MGDKVLRLSDLLRASAPLGAPVELLLDSWAAVEDAVLADSGHAREDFTAASDALPAIAGAIADRRALAAAVMTARGEVCFADAAYRALFPDSGFRTRRMASSALNSQPLDVPSSAPARKPRKPSS